MSAKVLEDDREIISTSDNLLEAVTKVIADRDRLDVYGYWFCRGRPRCDGQSSLNKECKFCYRLFDDDPRTPEEIVAAMRYST